MAPASNSRLIAVGLKSWAAYSHDAIEGILRCGRELGGFQFRDIQMGDTPYFLTQLERMRPQGAILTLNSGDYAELAGGLPPALPVVNIGADRLGECPFVCGDDLAIVKTAIRHVRDCGYSRLAWLGWMESSGSARREQVCRQLVTKLNCFNLKWGDSDDPPDPRWDRGFDDWLRSLRTPMGIITWSGYIANRLHRACERLSLKVPRDVGILSLADEQVCLLSEPAISALDLNGEAIGYRAMKLLAALVNGQRVVGSPVMIKPVGVIARASTGTVASSSDEIEAAREYIEKNACAGITVDNVVATVTGMGRTRFYEEFAARIGHSPAEHIRHVRLERAKELLSGSQLSITRIAGLCGYGSVSQFGENFKRWVGTTPLAYRRAQTNRSSRKAAPQGRKRPQK